MRQVYFQRWHELVSLQLSDQVHWSVPVCIVTVHISSSLFYLSARNFYRADNTWGNQKRSDKKKPLSELSGFPENLRITQQLELQLRQKSLDDLPVQRKPSVHCRQRGNPFSGYAGSHLDG